MPGQSIITPILEDTLRYQFYEWRVGARRFSSGKYNHRKGETVTLLAKHVKKEFLFFSRCIHRSNNCSGGDILMASVLYISTNDNCKKKGKKKKEKERTKRRGREGS